MLVAVFVYIASYFGYIITEHEALQEEKDILLKTSTLTFAPGILFRDSEYGDQSVTFSFGFEKQLTPYSRKWAFHTNYRFASEARSTVDQIGSFKEKDHYLSLGMMYSLGKTSIYFDVGPYARRSQVEGAATLGLSQQMSAFGVGFKPNLYMDYVTEGDFQFGFFANFEVF